MAIDDEDEYENAAMREYIREWKKLVSEHLRRALAGEPISRARCVDPDL